MLSITFSAGRAGGIHQELIAEDHVFDVEWLAIMPCDIIAQGDLPGQAIFALYGFGGQVRDRNQIGRTHEERIVDPANHPPTDKGVEIRRRDRPFVVVDEHDQGLLRRQLVQLLCRGVPAGPSAGTTSGAGGIQAVLTSISDRSTKNNTTMECFTIFLSLSRWGFIDFRSLPYIVKRTQIVMTVSASAKVMSWSLPKLTR